MSSPLLRCREVRPYLSAYVDGELDEELQKRVKAHLASCDACSRQVETYLAIDGLVSAAPASSPSPEVLDRVLAATSRQNSERAVRQSLRRPERPVAPRLLPSFLIADTNLAAPIPPLRKAAGRRRSWIIVTALPTLAALLLVAVTFISFHAQRLTVDKATPVPTVSKVSVVDKTDQLVNSVVSQLPFEPQMPSNYPLGTELGSNGVRVETFPNGTKYLDVVWTLAPPFTTLHLREVGVSLKDRATLDYVEAQGIALQTWQIPNYSRWMNMYDRTNSGRLVEGEDFPSLGFSVTLDIGLRGGNLNEYNPNPADYQTAVADLRLVSLSIDQQYMPLPAVEPPNASEVVHFQVLTTGVSDGKTYEWDVYWDSPKGLVRAALRNSSNILLYTDYVKGTQVIRCDPRGSCEDISTQSLLYATDPERLGYSVLNFYTQINADVGDAELWNMGQGYAQSGLGIGSELVYMVAFDDGPYPMTVYVSTATNQVVGITSDMGSTNPPGGRDAAYPLVGSAPLSSCSAEGYPLIVYLPDNSPNVPNMKAPTPAAGGRTPQIQPVATCQV
jgi:hypothetical protein